MALPNLRVIRLVAASVLAGLMIGLVGAAFRYLLLRVDGFRNAIAYAAHAWPHVGWIAPLLLSAVGAGLARLLVVRFEPFAGGSGIQHVEAVISGEAKPADVGIVPVKFVGGLLAIGSGLALWARGTDRTDGLVAGVVGIEVALGR